MPFSTFLSDFFVVLIYGSLIVMFSCHASAQSPGERIFNEVDQHVRQSFCDLTFNGIDWNALSTSTRRQLSNIRDRSDAARVINDSLDKLRTSHTQLLTLDDPELYELLGVFSLTESLREQFAKWLEANQRDGLLFEGVGLRCQQVGDTWFVRGVLPASSADKEGIRVGDEIVAVDGRPFHPLQSFASRNSEKVSLSVRSQPTADPVSVQVLVSRFDPTTMFHDAIDASVRVLKQGNRQVGYVRMWSYAGQPYQDRLEQLLLDGKLAECDGLILDLRGGWGGASPDFLDLFLPPVLDIDSVSRVGTVIPSKTRWSKPTILLIDDTVRSGKELFTYGFKKLQRGPIIGERTAGAVTAGSVFTLSEGCVLYLAVRRLTVDGQNLEGVGVEPTIEVKSNWQYSHGVDAPLERALLEMDALMNVK
jgi:carboxyl-terminal processing protease